MSLALSAPRAVHQDCPILSRPGDDLQDPQSTECYSVPKDRGSALAGVALDTSECTPLLRSPHPDIYDTALPEQIPTSKMFYEELRILAAYSLPAYGTQLFDYSFIIASVVSIGHISTLDLAGATLGSMTASVTGYTIVLGFASTLDTLLPPAWTSETPHMVGLWTQRTMVMMGGILIPISVIWLSAESILLTLNQDPEVARLAALYLRCALLGLPAYAFNTVSRRYFQSQGLFDIPTRITLVVAPINAFLNWLFVYPLGLSFPGAPLATALSFNLVSAASIFYGRQYVPPTAWSPITPQSLSPVTGELWQEWGLLAKLGIAGVGQTASEWWSWELVGLAASQLGPVTLAAQSVLLLSASTTYQAPFALGVATSVRVGNLLGQGDQRRAKVAAATSVALAITLGCIFSAIFLLFRHKWSYLFNSDPEVVSLVASILPLVALFQVFDGAATVTGGIFRARGKQFAGAILNITAYYALGIPLGLYLTFVCGRGLAGLWEGLTLGLVYVAGAGIWFGARSVNWEAEVKAARERIGGKSENERGGQ